MKGQAMKTTFKTLTSYFNYIGKLNIQYMKEEDVKARENLKKEIGDLIFQLNIDGEYDRRRIN